MTTTEILEARASATYQAGDYVALNNGNRAIVYQPQVTKTEIIYTATEIGTGTKITWSEQR